MSDNCSAVGDIVIAHDAPSSFPVGMTTVNWTATDEAWNIGLCTQLITVIDGTPPVVTCGGVVRSTNVGCTFVPPGGGASALGQGVSATDNCSLSSQIALTNDAVGSYNVGAHTINWTATDPAGNSASCAQTLTVIDGTAPVLVCPPDITRGANSGLDWIPAPGDLGMAMATDNCPGAVAVTNDAPATFPAGDTVVAWMATDLAGNVSICSQTVTVQDAMAP